MTKAGISLSSIFIFLVIATGCSTPKTNLRYPPVRWLNDSDDQAIRWPKEKRDYQHWDMLNQTVVQPLVRNVDLSEIVMFEESQNVNNFDEVADSSWFTNRIGRTGDYQTTDFSPATGPWEIISANTRSHPPALMIRDGRGTRYLLKFDAPGFPELATGAEVISTRFLQTIGYNAPDATLVWFRPETLKLSPDATRRDRYDRKRLLTPYDMDQVWDKIEKMKDGRARAVAVKIIEGTPLGPFSFKGRRRRDSNDRIRHQQRRELRSLRVFAAFLNHRDAGESNTMDAFIPLPGLDQGYIRHYLVDFDESLGSGGSGPMKREHLYDYGFNFSRVLTALPLAGGYRPFWENLEEPKIPEVGMFESAYFKPWTWKPTLPNAAFVQLTNRDGFWASKILMKFSDKKIQSIVHTAHYSRPDVERMITEILKRRRDKIGEHWFQKVNPLDDFEIKISAKNRLLAFHDLAVDHGMESSEKTSYSYRFLDHETGLVVREWDTSPLPAIPIDDEILKRLQENHSYIVRIRTDRVGQEVPLPVVDIIVEKNRGNQIIVTGIKRL